MLIEITKPSSSLTELELPPCVVTPFSLMQVMAYLHYYTPKRLPDSRMMAANHLRQLAQLVDKPDSQIRTIRQHKPLATHLALLYAANYLPNSGSQLILLPTVANWLHADSQAQLEKLIHIIKAAEPWNQTLSTLNLQDIITEDYTLYVYQSLTRQLQAISIIKETTQPASWQKSKSPEIWQLNIPPTQLLWLQFDLRQLGHWNTDFQLTCTPTSIATAIQRGYGPETIQWLLETATQQPLPEAKETQLHQWHRRAHAYRLRTVHLLTTAQDEQLATLMRRKHFRSAVIEQIAPRHAIVSHDIVPQLEKYLAKQDYSLAYSPNQPESIKPEELEANSAWLAARIMIGLGQIVPLPCPAPHSLLAQLENQLDSAQKTELEAIATTFLQKIREAISGRDAFLPAKQPPSPTIIQTIRSAIIKEQTINLTYQAMSESKASLRQVQPLRLEQRGNLYYLYAYCFRAEMNLTFRLDRIKEIV
ncbi:MAG: WYL domain-containing protein [Ardenticatenaceae bacterium]|nr:WYL domain-containing protein [Ardenticatenaceae bacterium]